MYLLKFVVYNKIEETNIFVEFTKIYILTNFYGKKKYDRARKKAN
jgi:hypothetical protein